MIVVKRSVSEFLNEFASFLGNDVPRFHPKIKEFPMRSEYTWV